MIHDRFVGSSRKSPLILYQKTKRFLLLRVNGLNRLLSPQAIL